MQGYLNQSSEVLLVFINCVERNPVFIFLVNFSLEITLEFVFPILTPPSMIKVTKFLSRFDSKLPLFHPTYQITLKFYFNQTTTLLKNMSKTFYSKRTGCFTVPKCHFIYKVHPSVDGIYFAKNAFPLSILMIQVLSFWQDLFRYHLLHEFTT